MAIQALNNSRLRERIKIYTILVTILMVLVPVLLWQTGARESNHPATTAPTPALAVEETQQMELAQQQPNLPPVDTQEVSSPVNRPPPICIIDDSGDMLDDPKRRRFDGFSTRRGGWPILTYLLPALGCDQCCFWSAFRNSGTACAAAGANSCNPGEPRIPRPLQATSPLVSTIATATQSALDRDIFFITNGLDWPTEGQDGKFAVEMNIGGTLHQWITANQANDLLIGIVQDNDGRKRRPNMVIGLVREFAPSMRSDSRCTVSLGNVPQHYSIDLSIYHNPRSLLNDNTLVVRGPVRLDYSTNNTERRQSLTISLTGVAYLPRPFTRRDRVEDPKVTITFQLPEQTKERSCWGMKARVNGSESEIEGDCNPTNDGDLECTFPMPQVTGSNSLPWKLAFRLVPKKPTWWEQLGPQHALRQTFKSLQGSFLLQPRIRVKRHEAKEIDVLTLTPREGSE